MYPQSCVIVRDTFTTNDDWGQPTPVTPSQRTVRVFLQGRDGQELRQANDAGPVGSTHKAYFPPGTDIVESDRVLFEDEIFDVRLVVTARGLRGPSHREVALFRVKPQ